MQLDEQVLPQKKGKKRPRSGRAGRPIVHRNRYRQLTRPRRRLRRSGRR
jgi:hypothetical protein